MLRRTTIFSTGRLMGNLEHMKRILIAAGVVIAVVTTGFVMAPSLVPQKDLKEKISRAFTEATGWTVRLDGRTSVQAFPSLAVEVDNLGVAGIAGADGVEFVRMERARFELRPFSLFRGELEIERVVLHKPNLQLAVGADGVASWAVHSEQSDAKDNFGTQLAGVLAGTGLQALEIVDGRLSYSANAEDQPFLVQDIYGSLQLEEGGDALASSGRFTFGGADYEVQGRLGSLAALSQTQATSVDMVIAGPGQAELSAKGQLAFKDRPVGALSLKLVAPEFATAARQFSLPVVAGLGTATAEADVQFRQRGIKASKASFYTETLKVTGDLDLNYLEDGYELEGQVSGNELNFEQLLKLAGYDLQGSGFTNINLSFYGVGQNTEELLTALDVDGQGLLRKGRIAGLEMPALLAITDKRESLDDMDLTFDFSGLNAPLEMKGTARWRGEPIALSGEVGRQGDLSLAFSNELFSGSLSGPYSLTEGFEGRFAFETPELRKLALWYGKALPRYLEGERLRVSGLFENAGPVLNFEDARFELDDIALSGKGTLELTELPKVSGTLAVEQASFDRMFAGKGQAGKKRPYDFSVLRDFELDAELTIAEFSLRELVAQDATLSARLEDGRLALAVERVDLFGGEGAGEILLNGATVKPGVSADFALRGVNAAPFLASLGDMPRVDGNLYAAMDLKTSGLTADELWTNMAGALSFQLGRGQLHELDVNTLIQQTGTQKITGWPFEKDARTAFNSWGADVAFNKGLAEFRGLTLQSEKALMEGQGSIDLKDGEVLWYLQPSLLDQSSNQLDEELRQYSALRPIRVDGAWDLPSFSPSQVEDVPTASAGLGELSHKVAARLAEDVKRADTIEEAQRLRAAVRREEATDKAHKAVVTGNEAAAADVDVLAGDATVQPVGTVMPIAKPHSIAQTAEAAAPRKTKVLTAPKRDIKRRDVVPRGPGNVDVEAVAEGTADTDETLSSLEEAFGMPPGFLSE